MLILNRYIKGFLLAVLIATAFSDVEGGFFPGALRDHGHTGPGDGGLVSFLTPATAFRAPDGSATTPSYSFSSDTNTGFYWYTDGAFALTLNGTNRMTFDSTLIDMPLGNAGAAGLRVANGQAFSGNGTQAYIRIQNADGTGDTMLQYWRGNTPAAEWTMGSDSSDSSTFKLSKGATLGTNDAIYVSTNSRPTFPSTTLVRAQKLSAAQTIPTGATTKVTFTNEVIDRLSEYDSTNSTFTAAQAGNYRITLQAHWSTNAGAAALRYVEIFKNNTTTGCLSQSANAPANEGQSYFTSCIMTLAAGDKIHAVASQSSTANLDILNVTTWLEIEWVP